VLAGLVVVAVAGVVALTLLRERRESAERSRLAQDADLGPKVLVAQAARPAGRRSITLPGDLRPQWQSTLYAKVNGYVSEILVDKGDRVRRGQVLARISSPETDDQVRSAAAALALRRRNQMRVRRLAPTGYVSRAEVDQAETDLRGAQAEYQRLRALQEYEVLRAPFDGLVTTRYVDPGALLTASATGAPVVDLADPRQVLVYVYVGQDVAPFVRVGDPGEVTLDQLPGVHVPARVVRVADAIDPRSRSMLVELGLQEVAGVRLVPGLFVHVALSVASPPLPTIPSDALVSRGDRLEVATVRSGHLHFQEVVPGDTDGSQLQIREGLQAGEIVALSPPSDLGESAPVQPVMQPRQGGPAPQSGGGRPTHAAR
jgi:RND family efflux transporter MFP subunit